jgi:hypothetical protein
MNLKYIRSESNKSLLVNLSKYKLIFKIIWKLQENLFIFQSNKTYVKQNYRYHSSGLSSSKQSDDIFLFIYSSIAYSMSIYFFIQFLHLLLNFDSILA